MELSITITTALWLLLNRLIKDKNKSSLLVTYFLLLFYSYGHVLNALNSFLLKNAVNENNLVFFLFWVMLLLTGEFLIVKFGKRIDEVTVFLCLTGLILIFTSVTQIVMHSLKYNRILADNYYLTKINNLFFDINKNSDLTRYPDFYYIILDGYASNEVLKNIYGYDNGKFTDFLISNGFYIPSQARSNYALTYLSLASSLNMKYINYLIDIIGITSREVPIDMIRNNQVLKTFESKGYKSIHFSSGWGATDRNQFSDLTIYCGKINQFATILLQTTLLKPLEDIYLPENVRGRILCTFSQLGTIRNDIDGPIFVFAHVVSPHPPFVFGENGEEVKEPTINKTVGLDSWQNKEDYINQLIFINKKVEALVKNLTADKSNLPVIIIQADHGSASTLGMEENNPALIQERMRPFMAFFLPGKSNFIDNSITPVNIFRLIFNNYFNTNFELLENKIYFSTYDKPYKFMDVTEAVYHP